MVFCESQTDQPVLNSREMKERNEHFPSALEAFFVVIALFVAEYVVGAALYDLKAFSGVDPRDVLGVVALFGNSIVFTALMHYKRLSYASLFHPSQRSITATLGTLSLPILLIIPALTLAMWTLMSALVLVAPMSRWEEAMFNQMMSNGLVSMVSVCIIAPVLEEMLFRGVILRSFLHQYSPRVAIAGSAALFGLAHLNLYQFFVGFLLGLVAGWLYERSRSLWPCILFHAAYNSAVTAIYFLQGSVQESDIWQMPALYWAASFVFAFAGTTMLQRFLLAKPVRKR